MRTTHIHWILLAALTLTPAAAVAQQPVQEQVEKPQAKAEETKKEEPQKAADTAQPKSEEESKLTNVQGGKALGMSILGNQEAPKALVIVPWKSSELGNGPGVSTLLDDSRLPVDKEVFMRMLNYYQIRSETVRPSDAPSNGTVEVPANAEQRRKP